jgi:hypothetical protein
VIDPDEARPAAMGFRPGITIGVLVATLGLMLLPAAIAVLVLVRGFA